MPISVEIELAETYSIKVSNHFLKPNVTDEIY